MDRIGDHGSLMMRITLSILVINLLMMGSIGWAEEPAAQSDAQAPAPAGEPSSPPSQEHPTTQPAEAAPTPAPSPTPPPAPAPPSGAPPAEAPKEEKAQKAIEQPEEKKRKTEIPPETSLIKGRLQIEFAETYVHLSSNQLFIEGFGVLPILVVGPIEVQRIRRDLLITTFTARYKITEKFQVALNVPFQFTFNRTSAAAGTAGGGTTANPNTETFSSAATLGDINGGMTYQVLDERLIQPSVFLSLGFKGRTGQDVFEGANPSGSGFNSISLSINAAKTSDPAVLFGYLSYAYAMPRRNVVFTGRNQPPRLINFEPGDNIGMGFGIAYALNYKLTLSMQYQQSINLPSMVDQKRLANTLTNSASLRFGWVWRINDKTSIDLSVTAGLTLDAPDALLALRIPWRF